MTASSNTGKENPATRTRKSPTRKKSVGSTDQTKTKDSSNPSSQTKPTDNQKKSSTTRTRSPNKKPVEDAKTNTGESQKSPSEKISNEEIRSASTASDSQRLSTSGMVDKQIPSGSNTNDRQASSVLPAIALSMGLLSLILSGYAVYSTQFDSKLERMRQLDQIAFLEQRVETLQDSQSTLEMSITNLRLSSAEQKVANQERQAELREQIATQGNSIRQLNAVSLEELTGQIESFRADLDSLFREVDQTTVYFQEGAESWTLKEVEYLLLVADHRLRLTGESNLVLEVLEIASTRMDALDNRNYFEVKRLLDQNIQVLKSRARIDTLSLLREMRVLNDRVSYLPLLGDFVDSGASNTNSQKKNTATSVQDANQQSQESSNVLFEASAQFLNSITDLIQVEKNNRPVRPVMSGELRRLIYERTHILLELAESALIRNQHVLVAERLNVLRSWVSDSFEMDSDITIEWISMLDDILTNLTVTPPLDLSESIAALQDVIDS
ncbi:MAG: uroporphyrinogen-III C-methyltransferase [Gammaproteobacteria bacterium]|nr:uroporphyrinogen-III C-methyltransferase [Gammaproteobacteria bacterium]MCY4217862.1 uroporphyrinogen-III C-methyltransferase [Gammaproteobacteria bacterium]MCY4274891.1 uroporphyrinogen-III C-methyltransferase [Gammaproteobacteria bacterium]